MPTKGSGDPAHGEEMLGPEPNTAEVEEWATRERARRQAWLSGPTEAEKAQWAQREYERRSPRLDSALRRAAGTNPSRVMQRYMREFQLATEGAVSLLINLSISDAFDKLVEAGREWEDEFARMPPRRRRVALEPERDRGEASARVPVPSETPPTG
jgi:hypothetical protein